MLTLHLSVSSSLRNCQPSWFLFFFILRMSASRFLNLRTTFFGGACLLSFFESKGRDESTRETHRASSSSRERRSKNASRGKWWDRKARGTLYWRRLHFRVAATSWFWKQQVRLRQFEACWNVDQDHQRLSNMLEADSAGRSDAHGPHASGNRR